MYTKYTWKGDIFPSFSMQLNPPVHSEPTQKKEDVYINFKKQNKTKKNPSVLLRNLCVCLSHQVHPRTWCNRQVWLMWWRDLSEFHFLHFSQQQRHFEEYKPKKKKNPKCFFLFRFKSAVFYWSTGRSGTRNKETKKKKCNWAGL